MVKKSIVKNIRNYLRILTVNGFDVRFGVVFGSQIKGNADMWSDIDLLVVSPRFDHLTNRKDIDQLWQIAAHVDSRIEPIPCGEKEWTEDQSRAIIEIARREGERISIEEKI